MASSQAHRYDTFLEIVTIPETLGRHESKLAALEKTIAYPVETQLNLGDPRVLLGLLLFSVAAFGDLLSTPARPRKSEQQLRERDHAPSARAD